MLDKIQIQASKISPINTACFNYLYTEVQAVLKISDVDIQDNYSGKGKYVKHANV